MHKDASRIFRLSQTGNGIPFRYRKKILIAATTAKFKFDAQAAPKIWNAASEVSCQTATAFTTAPNNMFHMGIPVLPIPCNAPVVTWKIPRNAIDGARWAITGAAFIVPYNVPDMGSASTHMPTEAGTTTSMQILKAYVVLCIISSVRCRVKASETAGTRLAASDMVGMVAIMIRGWAIPVR